MLVVTFALMIAAIIAVYWSARIAMGFGRDLRSGIFRKVESFTPGRGQPVRRRQSLITRNTNDVQQVQQVVLMGLNMMISAPIMTIGGVIMALRQDVAAVRDPARDHPDHGAAHRLRDDAAPSRCSRRCRSSSTGSTS